MVVANNFFLHLGRWGVGVGVRMRLPRSTGIDCTREEIHEVPLKQGFFNLPKMIT